MAAPDETHRQLGAFVDGWMGLAAAVSLRDLKADQGAPWASLSNGAAGNAYALWHVAARRRDPAPIAGAQRWWRFAARAAEQRSGFRTSAFARIPLVASVPFGRPGLHVVEALLAHARGAAPAKKRALAQLAAALGRGGAAQIEFMNGRAGGLSAALHVHRVTGDPAMRAVADALAARLLAEPPIAVNGFAHGQVGVQHALLAWSHATGAALPSSFTIAAPSDDEIIARTPPMAGTWCNGLPGFVFLWVKAFEVTGAELWRTRARETMRALAADARSRNGSLCCGLGGQAYAALALARIDASADWRAHATALCTHALAQTQVHGLFRGLAGLVCLAADLTTPGEARFPLVEP